MWNRWQYLSSNWCCPGCLSENQTDTANHWLPREFDLGCLPRGWAKCSNIRSLRPAAKIVFWTFSVPQEFLTVSDPFEVSQIVVEDCWSERAAIVLLSLCSNTKLPRCAILTLLGCTETCTRDFSAQTLPLLHNGRALEARTPVLGMAQ